MFFWKSGSSENVHLLEILEGFQRATKSPEFAQPRLSRVKRRSFPATGYNLGVFVPIWPVIEDARVMTGHNNRNKHSPNLCPPRWGRPPFDPTETGLCKFGWVWSSLGYPLARNQYMNNSSKIRKKMNVRKNVLLAILGPEMAAPIYGCLENAFFVQETRHGLSNSSF